MKVFFRLCAMCIYLSVIYIALDCKVNNIFSIRDFIMLSIGSCVFMIVYYIEDKEVKSIHNKMFKSVFWSGLFISLISSLSFVMNEKGITQSNNSIVVNFLICIRTLLYAFCIDILLYKKNQNQLNFIENKNKYQNLTNREYEICLLIVQGLSNKEIGDKLCISPFTVKKHVYNIFSKYDISQRSEIKYLINREMKTN